MGTYINYDGAINILVKNKDIIEKASFPNLRACDVLATLPRVELDPLKNINVSKVIKELRTKKKWTQRQLAEKSGISRQTTWNVERDNHGTTVYTFEKLLNAMGYELAITPIERRD